VIRAGGVFLLLALAACGASTPAAVPAPPRPVAASFPDDPRPLPHYHSARMALTLPLPDGRAWRIDDHSTAELVATHPPTRSRVMVTTFRTEGLGGRSQCEYLARQRGLVPALDDVKPLEDVTGLTQENYDTRTVVAVLAGVGPDQPIVGHVMAFGGFLRKCFVFDFSTEVDAASDEPVLSSRLAFARARIFGGLALDPFAAVKREEPTGPAAAPPVQ
jgi:hypothetical protein